MINDKSKDSPLSYVPANDTYVNFLGIEVDNGKVEWDYSVMGHAIGWRPFYGSLLVAIKRKCNFKGDLDLLTLDEDFILFKFSYKEYFNLVNDHNPYFLKGRHILF